ncbi:MAG: FtsX-like permease family protein [Candidatus Peribacter sp.]|jgi:putative ABC transport system permease protein|nr:FtsX-like permease family protein [Candidatus Peribacter sp.]MBT4392589.1 FtsX-like permease family protein [Candidatus Peribacter sp.]MBT4600410.1 FtsX-like permease family protein [Candidatus Peribacter sp.]MBT5149098.1 FtsX-like permease family protein [Candidatus Peribacter sp.]MBT5637574.1 FtsX-like permease family protein [Candidatus Peribacter sp.]
MHINDTVQASYKAVTAHRMRSVLTMLGIIIGVGSVVLLVSVGRSFERYVLDQVESFSSHLIEIYPTGFEKFGRSLDSLSFSDYEAVTQLSTVESVAPVIFVTEKVVYGTEEISPMVFGTTNKFFANYSLNLEQGRLLNESDIKGARSVAVLGYQAAIDLFGDRDPLGERIRVGKRFYTVVGTMETIGSALLQDLDTPVYVPFTTAKAQTGQKYLSYMTMKASIDDDNLVVADITSLLRQRHGIENIDNDYDKDDFRARSASQATEIVGSVGLGLTIFIGLIGGISLIVGGIGIMNIMLVSVTERTREIGLRKALGATRQDILRQFLIEAVALTMIGGVIGIVGGASLGALIAAVASKFVGTVPFVLSIPALLAAALMALATGLIFGIFPARKAASLSPMEAIRWEG